MALYVLKRRQAIPAPIHVVWDFVASPHNLKRITPDHLDFEILSDDLPDVMYAGMLIHYRVRPIIGIPMHWVSEITQVLSGSYFVDEQRVGPYAIWHHEHHLHPVENGTIMEDIVSYRPPLGPLGSPLNRWLIRPKLKAIFDYRQRAVEQIFGAFPK